MDIDNFIHNVNKELSKVSKEHADMRGSFSSVSGQHDQMLQAFKRVEKQHETMNEELAEIKMLLQRLLEK